MVCGPPPRSILITVLVVLAGCGGFAGADQTPTETVTPVPVPTDGELYPPGISESGVSAGVLVDAHERELGETSYTFVSRQRVVGSNGTMWTTNQTRQVGQDSYAGRIDHRVVEFPLGRFSEPIEYWGNDSVYASRRILTDQTEFYGWERTDQPPRNVTSLPLLERTLDATQVGVVRRSDGVTLVGSELRRPDRLPNPPYLTEPRNVSVTVRVSERGAVTSWQLAYDATLVNQTVRVTRETRLTAIGETEVRRPEWVDTARAQVTDE